MMSFLLVALTTALNIWNVISMAQNQGILQVLYDFDQTISASHMFSVLARGSGMRYAYSSDEQLHALNNCDDDCLTELFGGQQRASALQNHFNTLKSNGIDLGIVSYGYTDVITKALDRMDLLRYFDTKNIFGREALPISKVRRENIHAIKALFINHNFKQIPSQQTLFVDDDEGNMDYV
eukprot:6409_1